MADQKKDLNVMNYEFSTIIDDANRVDYHYVISVHDAVCTKQGAVFAPKSQKAGEVADPRNKLAQAFTDKRNALEVMETAVFDYIALQDGAEWANARRMEKKVPKDSTCLWDDEKRFLRKIVSGSFANRHYVTRDAIQYPDKFTVWRKHVVKRETPGWTYGTKKWEEIVVEKQFSVELIRIPTTVLSCRHPSPDVVYRREWYQTIPAGENMTEDQYIYRGQIDIAQAYSALLQEFEFFPYLASRMDNNDASNAIDYDPTAHRSEYDQSLFTDRLDGKDESQGYWCEPINLSKLRYIFNLEFRACPLAKQYEPTEESDSEADGKEILEAIVTATAEITEVVVETSE